MGSTAIQIVSEALRNLNLNEITSFSTTQEFPYKVALNVLNEVIRTMNRLGNYWFTETKTALPYTAGVYAYNFPTLGIDPKRVIRIRKEAANYWNDLKQLNWSHFQRLYRSSVITAAEPTRWSKFGNSLELNVPPDQDYSLFAYHFQNMPLIVNPSDTFLVPERDEDVLIDCCFQLLGYRVGRWDYATALQEMTIRITPLLANMKQDAGIPIQMPASF